MHFLPDPGMSYYFQSVEMGAVNNLSPNGTRVSWSYKTNPSVKRLPHASASLREKEVDAPVVPGGEFQELGKYKRLQQRAEEHTVGRQPGRREISERGQKCRVTPIIC
jgi:hypothetical protein